MSSYEGNISHLLEILMRERPRPHTSTQYTFIPTRQVLVLAVSIKLLPSSPLLQVDEQYF